MSRQRSGDDAQPLPRSFLLLLTAWAASLTGDGLRMVALPLLAAQLDRTPAAVAFVAAATAAPWLLIAVPAGALVDRWNPARVVAACHLGRAALTAALLAAIVTGTASIPLLCGFGFLVTSLETFADSAAQSMLVRSIPSEQLDRANARFVTVETVALDLIGSLAAGVLFQVQAWLPFAVSAALFAVSAVVVSRLIGLEGMAPTPQEARARLQVWSGLRILRAHAVLRVLVFTVAIMAIGNAAVDGQLVLYATGPLHLSEALYPTLLAAYSVGIMIAAWLAPRLTARFRSGPIMVLSLGGIGLTMLLMGLWVHPAVGWACYGVMGLAGGSWNILSASRRQRHTPPQMIARVSSAFRVIAWGFAPLGSLIGGAIGEAWSVPMVFTVSGIGLLVLGLAVSPAFVAPEPTPPGHATPFGDVRPGPGPAGGVG